MSPRKAVFIDPMLLLRTERLPEGPEWNYEIKLDGYRALAIKRNDEVQLRSRNDNDFSIRYPEISTALAEMPNETVIDGEVLHSARMEDLPSTHSKTMGPPAHRCTFTFSTS